MYSVRGHKNPAYGKFTFDIHIILYVNISAGMSRYDYSYHNIIKCHGQKSQDFMGLHTQNFYGFAKHRIVRELQNLDISSKVNYH